MKYTNLCHNIKSKKIILEIIERFKDGGKEELLKVLKDDLKIFVSPVKNSDEELIGYFVRFDFKDSNKYDFLYK